MLFNKKINRNIKILIQNRMNLPGGAAQQTELMAPELSKLGYDCTVSDEENLDLTYFDLVHLNNISNIGLISTKNHYINCKKQNKPFLVKCIWFEPRLENRVLVSDISESASYLTFESSAERSEFFKFLEYFFSKSELNSILKKSCIMFPGVSHDIKDSGTPLIDRPFVHTNGRYRDEKNIHEVLMACKKKNLPVIVSGFPVDKDYYNLCESIDYGTVLPELNKKELNEIYNKSRIYVCASKRELNSTSVNEAIACGCIIISTERHLANAEYDKPGYFVYNGTQEGLERILVQAYHSVDSSYIKQENTFWNTTKLAEQYDKIYRKILGFSHK